MPLISHGSSLVFQLEIVTQLCKKVVLSAFKENIKNDILFDEYVILDTIVCHKCPDKNTLTKVLFASRESLSKILINMEKRGLIKRKNNDSDNPNYALTAEGRRIYQDISSFRNETVKLLARFICENELVAFTKTLLKIRGIIISLNNKEEFSAN